MTILGALLLGFILTLFNMDYHLTKAASEWTGKNISESTYWAFWFLLGLLVSIPRWIGWV